MLTIELLKQNAALAGLTDDQLNAVAEMSRNDENTVIGARIGALHGQYDADILGITGMAKNEGEKSYDYAKRVLSAYKDKAGKVSGLQADLKAANDKAADLQVKLESGEGNETVRQQLKDAKTRVEQLQAQLQEKQTALDTKAKEYADALKNVHVDYAFRSAVSELKFKSGITPAIQKTLLNAAKAEIMAKGTPELIDDEKGGKKLVLRGADGNILNNPQNNLNPYTLKELVMETTLKDVIETGRKQPGTGTGDNRNDDKGNKTFLDISAAKSQVEADKIIESHLLANGLTRDSYEFAKQSLQLREDNKVAELPIK